jgi:hypothetical protein
MKVQNIVLKKKNKNGRLTSMIVHLCNPSTREEAARGLRVQGHPELQREMKEKRERNASKPNPITLKRIIICYDEAGLFQSCFNIQK